jgi:hypothetical protein
MYCDKVRRSLQEVENGQWNYWNYFVLVSNSNLQFFLCFSVHLMLILT